MKPHIPHNRLTITPTAITIIGQDTNSGKYKNGFIREFNEINNQKTIQIEGSWSLVKNIADKDYIFYPAIINKKYTQYRITKNSIVQIVRQMLEITQNKPCKLVEIQREYIKTRSNQIIAVKLIFTKKERGK